VFLNNVGLGVGIDFGSIAVVNHGTEVTVVGVPVVYACRLSSTAGGTTVLNGNAFDYLMSRHSKLFKHQTVPLDLKHEGPATVFVVELMEEVFDRAKLPDWAKIESVESREEDVDRDSMKN
jgi:adenylate cyclase